jgi:hypothetical protein
VDIRVDRLRCCDLREQGAALLAANGQETGHRELDIDWSVYSLAEDAHKLLVFGAWAGEALVGYVAGFFIDKHIQHQSWCYAQVDVFYIDPDHRNAATCEQLMGAFSRAARSLTATSVLWGAKAGTAFERVLDSKDRFKKFEVFYEEQIEW